MEGPPEGDNISVVLSGLCMDQEEKSLGMREEHIKFSIRKVTRENVLEPTRWDKLVSVMKLEFREGRIPEALTYT